MVVCVWKGNILFCHKCTESVLLQNSMKCNSSELFIMNHVYASSILYDCFVHYICDVYKNAHFASHKNIYIILFCGTASAMILVLWNRDVGLWWPQIPDSSKSNILEKWNSNIGRPILIRRPSIRYKINHIVSSVVANSKKKSF